MVQHQETEKVSLEHQENMESTWNGYAIGILSSLT